jgi:hypothetical protein
MQVALSIIPCPDAGSLPQAYRSALLKVGATDGVFPIICARILLSAKRNAQLVVHVQFSFD